MSINRKLGIFPPPLQIFGKNQGRKQQEAYYKQILKINILQDNYFYPKCLGIIN